MGWTGALIGGYLGSRVLGPLGALLGAVMGSAIEKAAKSAGEKQPPPRRQENGYGRSNQMVFCASAAAMLAKMAKADGVVTQSEIATVEKVFSRLGFTAYSRQYAIDVFRRAKDDNHTIFEYAADFAAVVEDIETRELFYELLWELAAADGKVTDDEVRILGAVTRDLKIAPYFFNLYSRQYSAYRRSSSQNSESRRESSSGSTLSEAYEVLGVSQSATDDEVKKAYREKAKQLHPDRLRAQGLPDGMIAKANERMASVNDAWAKIKAARGIK